MKQVICAVLSTSLSLLVFLLGDFDVALQAIIIAVILDYITGVIKAYVCKELSSVTGFKGIVKKVSIFLIIMLAVLVDRVAGETGAIRTLVIYYFVANEGLSIIENLGQAGVPIPQGLKNALKAMKKGGKK